jgi:hypothetical protein
LSLNPRKLNRFWRAALHIPKIVKALPYRGVTPVSTLDGIDSSTAAAPQADSTS